MASVYSKIVMTGLMTNVYHANKDLDLATEFVSKLIQSNANDLILYFFRCVLLHIFSFFFVLEKRHFILIKKAIKNIYNKLIKELDSIETK